VNRPLAGPRSITPTGLAGWSASGGGDTGRAPGDDGGVSGAGQFGLAEG